VDVLRPTTEYDWTELWRAVVGLLGFLSNKLDSLITTGGVETLAKEVSVSTHMILLPLILFLLDAGNA